MLGRVVVALAFADKAMLLLEQQGIVLLQDACHDLKHAVQFKALLNVILMMGNYMNGSNYGGGAYGFKIASINRASQRYIAMTEILI